MDHHSFFSSVSDRTILHKGVEVLDRMWLPKTGVQNKNVDPATPPHPSLRG